MRVTRITDWAGIERLKEFFAEVKDSGGDIGWDIETTPIQDFYFRKVRTVQFGNQTEQYVIDLKAFAAMNAEFPYQAADLLSDAQGHYGKNLTPNLKRLMEVLEPVLCTADFTKVGVMLSFEYMNFYWQFGLRTWNFWDCAMVEKCIWAGAHSLKDYSFFSMQEMMERYFQVHIDKQYQESFTLEADLLDDQIMYAALDTRFPLALKRFQELIISGRKPKSLAHLDPDIFGDDLTKAARIENEAIGAFEDMHIHGENMNCPKWMARNAKQKIEYYRLIREELDPIFIPLVGTKVNIITDEDIEAAKNKWKVLNKTSRKEAELEAERRSAVRNGFLDDAKQLELEIYKLEEARKAQKEVLKTEAADLGKMRTKIRKLAATCEGEALVNYGSDAQLKKILNTMPEVQRALGKKRKKLPNNQWGPLEQVKLETLDDEILEKYEHIPVMVAIRKYHGLSKQLGTYGEQWAMQWKTRPCKEEGWLHPADGKLHSVFNQFDAETGRSSSEKPNGQNIEKDPEVRSCFIADPPDENIRISGCCEAETSLELSSGNYWCNACGEICHTHGEEQVVVTADMAGAELCIIGELAQDPIWIGAFARGEDVHSVGTELLYEEEWPAATEPGCEYFAPHTEETVAKNPLCVLGQPQRQKCKCPGHKALRDDNKSTNFLLAYGGGPGKLSKEIGKSFTAAKMLMKIHEEKNPLIWKYLKKSGEDAQKLKKSFDMFGGRRLFPTPTTERAEAYVMSEYEKDLRLPDDQVKKNMEVFFTLHGKKPDEKQAWVLKHRMPTGDEIAKAYVGLGGSIERQGKNHAIQGTNARIAKKAMGCGFDPNGIPYLWHTLPQFKAKLIKFVHDELVVSCPKRYGQAVAALIGDAFKRAAAEVMKQVVMKFDYHVESYWKK